jgi:RimJ/RimL family protein N-acetyltransferase
VELVPYTDADMWLTEALETDPRVMAELGGPWPLEKIPGIHGRRLQYIANGSWYLKVVPEPGARAVGAVMVWHSEVNGEPLSEMGWMILPEHQGRGYASAAVRLLLERIRAEGGWGDVHAFPGATNAPSNAICRKSGFELVGEIEVDYGGRPLRVNHWVRRAGKSSSAER